MNVVTIADDIHECEAGLNGFMVRYTDDHKRLFGGGVAQSNGSNSYSNGYAAPEQPDHFDDIPF